MTALPVELLVVLLLCSNVSGRSAIKKPEPEAEYMPKSKVNSADYDHESFLGHDTMEEFDKMTSEEAKQRLWKLIPLVDEDGNGVITEDELHDWIKKQLLVYIMDDARKLHKGNDVNHDGFVSWKEYVATTYGLGFVDNEQQAPEEGEFDYREMIIRDYNKFISADANGDQFLSLDELAAFIHPEEFHHTKHLVFQESMQDLDRNKDGRVSLEEFLVDLREAEDEVDADERPEWIEREKREFMEYRDLNNDGYLDMSELKEWLQPNGVTPALAEARHLIALSDSDKDGSLNPQEIINNFRVFVGSQATDYGKMLHSEL